MPVLVRRLEPTDDRSRFESGQVELDRFFQLYAGQNQFRHHVGVTYVAVDSSEIAGYATVVPSQIEVADLPKGKLRRIPNYPIPVLRLARLAVDRRAQGQGTGLALLRTVFELTRQLARDFGCVGLVVDSKPEAVLFYERFGFVSLPLVQGQLEDRPQPIAMFLELGAIPLGNE